VITDAQVEAAGLAIYSLIYNATTHEVVLVKFSKDAARAALEAAERAVPPDDAYARGYRDGQAAMREAASCSIKEAATARNRSDVNARRAFAAIRALPIKEPGA